MFLVSCFSVFDLYVTIIIVVAILVIMVIMMMVTMLIMAMVSVLHLHFLVPIERYVHPKKMCLQKVFPAYFLSISYVKTN